MPYFTFLLAPWALKRAPTTVYVGYLSIQHVGTHSAPKELEGTFLDKQDTLLNVPLVWKCFFFRSLFYKKIVAPVYISLHQFEEGLKLFGVLQSIIESPSIMKPLFTVHSNAFRWTAGEFLTGLDILYSPSGSNFFEKEVDIFKHFSDLVEQMSLEGILFLSTNSMLCPGNGTMKCSVQYITHANILK